MQFIEKLEELRVLLGAQKQELAEVLGISPQWLSAILGGKDPGDPLRILVDLLIERERTKFRSPLADWEQAIRLLAQEEIARALSSDKASAELHGLGRQILAELQLRAQRLAANPQEYGAGRHRGGKAKPGFRGSE